MKKFMNPEIEVVEFAITDVITVSGDEVIYGDENAQVCTPIIM